MVFNPTTFHFMASEFKSLEQQPPESSQSRLEFVTCYACSVVTRGNV